MDKIIVKVEDLDLARILNVAVTAVPCFGQFNVLIKDTPWLQIRASIWYFIFCIRSWSDRGGGGGGWVRGNQAEESVLLNRLILFCYNKDKILSQCMVIHLLQH